MRVSGCKEDITFRLPPAPNHVTTQTDGSTATSVCRSALTRTHFNHLARKVLPGCARRVTRCTMQPSPTPPLIQQVSDAASSDHTTGVSPVLRSVGRLKPSVFMSSAAALLRWRRASRRRHRLVVILLRVASPLFSAVVRRPWPVRAVARRRSSPIMPVEQTGLTERRQMRWTRR